MSPTALPSLPKASMAGRVLAALLLMIGFYALALGIAGVLGFIAYADVTSSSSRIHVKLVIGCVVGAGAILWAILPRWERFEAPGVRLNPADQPKLFKVIHEVAKATGQPMPAEVYVVNELNAFVSSRGGVMGFGSRRIMGIGLPMLQALSVSELRGVIAHEFGHYHGGDVKLGPWIYKTRAAIGRTLASLGKTGSAVLHKPFEWYGKLFMWVTLAISRRQEFAADALSARVVGKDAFVSGMRAVNRVAPGFEYYWRSEVVPVLSAGYRPPIADGFARFTASETMAPKLAEALNEALSEQETGAWDTHPAPRDRIAAVEAMADAKPLFAADPAPAVSLLRGIDALEQALVAFIADDRELTDKLKPLAWERVGEAVLVPDWEQAAKVPALAGLRLAAVPTEPARFTELGHSILGQEAQGAEPQDVAAHAARTLAAALSYALKHDGWTVESLPGDPVVLKKNGTVVEPFGTLHRLSQGEAEAAEKWTALTAAIGSPALSLGRPVAQA